MQHGLLTCQVFFHGSIFWFFKGMTYYISFYQSAKSLKETLLLLDLVVVVVDHFLVLLRYLYSSIVCLSSLSV